jgi:hypothetical protein
VEYIERGDQVKMLLIWAAGRERVIDHLESLSLFQDEPNRINDATGAAEGILRFL